MTIQFHVIERYSPQWRTLADQTLPTTCVNLEYDLREILTYDRVKPHIDHAFTATDTDGALIGLVILSTQHRYHTPDPHQKTLVEATADNVCLLEYVCGLRGGGTTCLYSMEQWLGNYFDGEEFVIQTCAVFEACAYYQRHGFRLGLYPQIPLVALPIPDFMINTRILEALYFRGMGSLTDSLDQSQAATVVEFIQGMNKAGLSLGISRHLASTHSANTPPVPRFTAGKRWYQSLNEGFGMYKLVWGN